MQNMPLEERMKLYKEKYASSKDYHKNNSGRYDNRKYDDKKGNKGYSKNRNGGKSYDKSYQNKNKNYNGKNNYKNYQNKKPSSKAPVKKQGIFARIKAFFKGNK